MRGNTIYQASVRAREQVELTIAFHDLRHTGKPLAAATGASLVDLVEGRDAQIADALSKLAESGDASKLPTSF